MPGPDPGIHANENGGPKARRFCLPPLSPRHCEERSDEAIQNPSAVRVWIALRSLSSGRAPRGPGGSQ
jgi:hypothetical protein